MDKEAARKTVDLPEACSWLGIGRSHGYNHAGLDEFPVPVIRLGRRIMVSREALEALPGTGLRGEHASQP